MFNLNKDVNKDVSLFLLADNKKFKRSKRKTFWLAVFFHHFWFQRSRKLDFSWHGSVSAEVLLLLLNYIKSELWTCVFRLAGFHYDACRTGHRTLHPAVQHDSHTVALDELTLKHMTEDCSSVKSQLLKLKSLLQVPHTHIQPKESNLHLHMQTQLLASEQVLVCV